jgi:hypothetical protein
VAQETSTVSWTLFAFPPQPTVVVMFDDGSCGDGVCGDGCDTVGSCAVCEPVRVPLASPVWQDEIFRKIEKKTLTAGAQTNDWIRASLPLIVSYHPLYKSSLFKFVIDVNPKNKIN